MKKITIIWFIVMISINTFSQNTWIWLIKPEYQETKEFSEGLALVYKNDQGGYIDITNKYVIEPKFGLAGSFHEGLAYAKNVLHGKAGYIDYKGNWVIQPKFNYPQDFSEGLASVDLDGKVGFIDKTGNFVIAPQYYRSGSFHEGLASVMVNNKWGYIDKKGNMIIAPQYLGASDFSEGLACVGKNGQNSVIDKKGNTVFLCESCGSFNEGLAPVQQKNGNSYLYGYMDKTGNWKIKPQFEDAFRFRDGKALVEGSDKSGFIDKNGKWLQTFNLELYGREFIDGIAIKTERINNKHYYGYIMLLTDQKSFVKRYVEGKISLWQKKGEFEKTNEYQTRVNEQNRIVLVQKYTDEAILEFTSIYENSVDWTDFQLNEYDADNESFLITSSAFGKFLLPVSLDYAQIFKENWSSTSKINADFHFSEKGVKLAKLTFKIPSGQEFLYDSKLETKYSSNTIAFNFAPIEIAMPKTKEAENNSIIENKTTIVGTADVDINIPSNPQINDKTFVVIIANENYTREVKVQYANNDGKVFKNYCEKTLGIPSKNIHFAQDATFGTMKSEIKWISDVASAFNGQAKLIFYYAGHGMPNEIDKSAYLLPIDGFSSDYETAIKLDDLYNRLNQSPTQSVTVFLDACFSGSIRDNGMLANARGVKINPKANALNGKMIVFSAATGNETAYPYNEKQHGLFTYFLLKKLQETKGNVDYQTLSNYIIENVKQQSIVVNQKSQTPQVNTSADIQYSWQILKIK